MGSKSSPKDHLLSEGFNEQMVLSDTPSSHQWLHSRGCGRRVVVLFSVVVSTVAAGTFKFFTGSTEILLLEIIKLLKLHFQINFHFHDTEVRVKEKKLTEKKEKEKKRRR